MVNLAVADINLPATYTLAYLIAVVFGDLNATLLQVHLLMLPAAILPQALMYAGLQLRARRNGPDIKMTHDKRGS